jgi:hypothetical protein
MDADRFDRLVLTLTRASTRRSVLGVLSALGLTGLAARDVAAVPCLVNGRRCLQGSACCSGRCQLKRGTTKKFCRRAPGQGICTIENNYCVNGSPVCESTGVSCRCFVTTRGFSYCGAAAYVCRKCTTDASCQQRAGGNPGDRCVRCATCPQTNNRACASACPDRATA